MTKVPGRAEETARRWKEAELIQRAANLHQVTVICPLDPPVLNPIISRYLCLVRATDGVTDDGVILPQAKRDSIGR